MVVECPVGIGERQIAALVVRIGIERRSHGVDRLARLADRHQQFAGSAGGPDEPAAHVDPFELEPFVVEVGRQVTVPQSDCRQQQRERSMGVAGAFGCVGVVEQLTKLPEIDVERTVQGDPLPVAAHEPRRVAR